MDAGFLRDSTRGPSASSSSEAEGGCVAIPALT